jgi:hypothetical protein
MSDEELCGLAENSSDLTENALQLLDAELKVRNLHPQSVSKAEPSASDPGASPVVVAKFISLHEASIAAGHLESAGIPVLLYDENLMRLDWLAGISIGGVRLAVAPDFELEARELLSNPIPERFEVEGIGEYEQPRCPRCRSFNVGSYLGEAGHADEEAWRCRACGALWQGSPDDNPAANPGSV